MPIKLVLQTQGALSVGNQGVMFSRSNVPPLGNKGYHGDVFYLGLPGIRLETGPMYSRQSHRAVGSGSLPSWCPLGLHLLGYMTVLGEAKSKGPALESNLDSNPALADDLCVASGKLSICLGLYFSILKWGRSKGVVPDVRDCWDQKKAMPVCGWAQCLGQSCQRTHIWGGVDARSRERPSGCDFRQA